MNSQENKKEDDVDVVEDSVRKMSKKLSLESNHNLNHIPINKMDAITDTADQMQYFSIFDYTIKMMDMNKENICYL